MRKLGEPNQIVFFNKKKRKNPTNDKFLTVISLYILLRFRFYLCLFHLFG